MPADVGPLFAGLEPEKVFTVGELTQQIKKVLEGRFVDLHVRGELSGFRPASSGHVYFNLKDADALLPCVLWRSAAQKIKFALSDGLEVILKGDLSLYPPQGRYQLTVKEIQPQGQGALELAFRQLKEKLKKRGWFDPIHKKSLPRIPKRIALVTSPTGAAIRDMLRIIPRRWPASELWVCPVKVQGEGAAAEIARSIQFLNQLAVKPEVMIVGRGGGSLEDLWAFNEEAVVKAIYESAIPVVSAVGHEIDVTLADLVADRRAATPSEAAELVVPDCEEMTQFLYHQVRRLGQMLKQQLLQAKKQLNHLIRRRCWSQPLEFVHLWQQRVDDERERLLRAMQNRLQVWQMQWQKHAVRLDSLSPLKTLSRGYSLTFDETTNTLLHDVAQTEVNRPVRIQLHRGSIQARITKIETP